MARSSTNPKSRSTSSRERRVATTDPDLFVVKVGERRAKPEVSSKEKTAGVLARLAKAMAKPGLERAHIFRSASGRPVYAYFIYSKDPTKFVREDASGRQTIGRFVSGRFRPTSRRAS